MPRLSLNDIELVNLVIADIYTIRGPEKFIQKLVAALNNLLPSDLLSYNEFNRHSRLVKVCAASKDHQNITRKYTDALNAYMPTHPGFGVLTIDRCAMISDLVRPSDFKKSALYNEYYRHLDVQTQMFTELPGSSGLRPALTFSRDKFGFTEEERLMFSLVKPHIINAQRNAMVLDSYRKKIELLEKGPDIPALHKFGLTFREATLLEWAAAGKTNKDIALILGISRRTVEKHLERIYEKLGVKTKIAALAMIMKTEDTLHTVSSTKGTVKV